jgi:hypothetical protein
VKNEEIGGPLPEEPKRDTEIYATTRPSLGPSACTSDARGRSEVNGKDYRMRVVSTMIREISYGSALDAGLRSSR